MPTKLGQNFLRDKSIVKKIIESANLHPDDFVIEVGPGEGVLTEELGKYAGKVLAIEIDQNLIKPLQKKFKNNEKVEIFNADILKINLVDLISNSQFLISNQFSIPKFSNDKTTQNIKYKVVANLPYYITSPIIRLFLETKFPPQEMILMVQKEVAERITAKAGEMSILAVSVQYYAKAEILFEVRRECFDPVPEVDSAVIRITNYELRITNAEAKKFFRIVRAGFCAKRKTLVNNLSNSLHFDKKEVEEKLESLGIKKTARAQELAVEDWKKIAEIFS